MKYSNEARVGAVVLGGLALMGGGYYFLRGISPGADNYYMRLTGPATVAEGSEVRLQGVKIGRVQRVSLDANTQKPVLVLSVSPSPLLRNYEYSVRSSSLVGEPYIDIRGNYTPSAARYQPNNSGDVIIGKPPVALTDLSGDAQRLSREVSVTLKKIGVTLDRINNGVLNSGNQARLAKSLDNLATLTQKAQSGFGPNGIRVTLGDEAAQRSLNRTLANADQMTRDAGIAARNISQLTRDGQDAVRNITAMTRDGRTTVRNINALSGNLNGTLGENRAQIKSLLANFNKTAQNAAGLTESLNFIVTKGGLKENARTAFDSLGRAAKNIELSTQGLNKVMGNAQTQDDLRKTVSALRATTEQLQGTATAINNIVSDPVAQVGLRTTLISLGQTAQNLEKTTEGIKNVLGDEKVQSDLKETIANLNGTLAATRATVERVGGFIGARTKKKNDDSVSTQSTQEGGAKPKKADTSTRLPQGFDFTLRVLPDAPRRSRAFGDLTFNTQLFGSPLRAGLAEIGDGTKLTLQSGKNIGRDGVIRYGLYRSKLGVGAQWQKGKLSLEGNLYDLNRRSANVYAGYSLTKQLEIIGGYEKRGDVRSKALGVRIRP